MLNKLTRILEKYLTDYAIIPYTEGRSNIVFFTPYAPYIISDNELFLDAYFKASNGLYHLTNSLIKELNLSGYNAQEYKGTDYKVLAVHAGLGSIVKSTLLSTEDYGTRVALGVVTVNGEYEIRRTATVKCLDCGRCLKACPTGAITNQGFNKEICLRKLQNKPSLISSEQAVAMGNKVWGCDICQKVCPLNMKVKEIPMDKELSLALNNLLCSCISGKKALQPLLPYIGYNYLKPKRLLALTLNALTNIGQFNPIAYELLESSDEGIRLMAERMISKYKKPDN